MVSMFVQEFIGALVQVALFAVVPFIVWLIAGRKKEKFFKWIGLKKPSSEGSAAKVWGIALAVTAVYFAVSLILTKTMFSDLPNATTDSFGGKGAAAVPAILAYAFIRTAFAEELLFRGFIFRLRNKLGFAAGNTVQALLFGALHGVPIFLKTQNVPALLLFTLLPGCMGWVMGWLDEKHDGSIIPGWLLHGTLNVVTAILAL